MQVASEYSPDNIMVMREIDGFRREKRCLIVAIIVIRMMINFCRRLKADLQVQMDYCAPGLIKVFRI